MRSGSWPLRWLPTLTRRASSGAVLGLLYGWLARWSVPCGASVAQLAAAGAACPQPRRPASAPQPPPAILPSHTLDATTQTPRRRCPLPPWTPTPPTRWAWTRSGWPPPTTAPWPRRARRPPTARWTPTVSPRREPGGQRPACGGLPGGGGWLGWVGAAEAPAAAGAVAGAASASSQRWRQPGLTSPPILHCLPRPQTPRCPPLRPWAAWRATCVSAGPCIAPVPSPAACLLLPPVALPRRAPCSLR